MKYRTRYEASPSAAALDHLYKFSKDDLRMRDFKKRNTCNVTGAWLMLSLQDEILDLDEAVHVSNRLVSLC
jgi:hypothetical protein